MLVYGDPEFSICSSLLIHALRTRLESTSVNSLTDLRNHLIQAGQIEQAFADQMIGSADAASRTTKAAADLFYAAYAKINSLLPQSTRSIPELLARVRFAVECLMSAEPRKVMVKVPEGFASYALFPEQYCLSALRWVDTHSYFSPKKAAIVGLRSIGTTLSAVVAATLEAADWETSRFTVRPDGHPFCREVEIDPARIEGCSGALIVDEGPGASGSSMAAVAEALIATGLKCERIFFFPAHNNEPGGAASERVRELWRVIPRFCTPLQELKWNGLSFGEMLAKKAQQFCGERFICTEDLSGGLWRKHSFGDQCHWPAAASTFEKQKYLCTSTSKKKVFWKFAGLGMAENINASLQEIAFRQLRNRSACGFCSPPLGCCKGFIAVPWIEGSPLKTQRDTNSSLLEHLARYIAQTLDAQLTESESEAAIGRLSQMLLHNSSEFLNTKFEKQIAVAEAAARKLSCIPGYGDGRMAPHEWIRDSGGTLHKPNCTSHVLDHTLVGRQTFYWDVAGVLVEWNLNKSARKIFLKALERTGMPIGETALYFYEAAYASFHFGQMSLCGNLHGNSSLERNRLEKAEEVYRSYLKRLFT